jgi:hypothetical protein
MMRGRAFTGSAMCPSISSLDNAMLSGIAAVAAIGVSLTADPVSSSVESILSFIFVDGRGTRRPPCSGPAKHEYDNSNAVGSKRQ